MVYRVTSERRHHYLHVRLEGPESYQEAVRFWQWLAEQARTAGVDEFMIVDEVQGRLSVVDHFEISEIVARLFAGKRIAYVDPKAETWDANEFGGTVINNRGGRAHVFRSEADAHHWLITRQAMAS